LDFALLSRQFGLSCTHVAMQGLTSNVARLLPELRRASQRAQPRTYPGDPTTGRTGSQRLRRGVVAVPPQRCDPRVTPGVAPSWW
jgi:hypothetical protein